jgi:transcriptional regulator with XRE-family HTH domain
MDAKTDNRWRECRGTWDRLRWARMAAGYERAKDFADSIGMKDGTYRTYERAPDSSKHSDIDHTLAIRFAKKLKVRWEWLLTGDGTPEAESQYSKAFPGKAKLRQLAEDLPEEQAAKVATAIEALLKAI